MSPWRVASPRMVEDHEPAADETFYARLPEIVQFADVPTRRTTRRSPATWEVAITDVQGSTAAIEAGRYRDVNAVGVASIIAVRNALSDLEFPYVFGGDGATFLLPAHAPPSGAGSAAGSAQDGAQAFGLTLRAGTCAGGVRLQADGLVVRAARFRLSEHIRLAMLAGNGISAAEGLVEGRRKRRIRGDGRRRDATVASRGSMFAGSRCRAGEVKW